MKYKEVKKYKDNKFKRIVGIPRVLFEILVEILKIAFNEKHKKDCRKPKLAVEDILLMTLTYYRNYSTFFF